MIKWLRRNTGKDDAGDQLPGGPYRVSGGLLIIAGLAVISPGIKDALLAYANDTYKLGLSLDAPWWIGLPLVGVGVLLFVLGFVSDRSGTSKGQFVAIRHQSFQPLAANLPKEAMPRRMQRRKIQVYDCDLSSFINSDPVDPAGAVRLQEKLAQNIAAVRKSDHDAAFGYYGIVHIPFQFLAGCSISTYPEVALFELDRNTNKWNELKSGDGPDLKPKLIRISSPAEPSSVVIRIEISYPISTAEPAKIVPGPYREYVLRIEKPLIDVITHYEQIYAVCRLFRQALDEVHNEMSSEVPIHVFYSGPVSLGFSLGRQISRTIHNRVLVYNYTSKANPAYSWGTDVTRDSPPQQMIIQTQLLQS